MELLSKDQIIEQTHGKGTYVGATIFEQSWAYKLTTTSEELNWSGIPFRTEVIELTKRKIKDSRIIGILNLESTDDEVIILKRLRYVSEIPVVLHETYFPAENYMGMLHLDFTKQTMTGALENILNINVAWAEHTISAIYADSEISKYLKMNNGEPVIYDEHILYNKRDEVIEFTKGWFRGDRFRLKTVVFRE